MRQPEEGEIKPDAEQIHWGSLAREAFARGENPPQWIEDEETWERAKKAALKSYELGDEAFWPVVVTIYQRMGGGIRGAKGKAAVESGPIQARMRNEAIPAISGDRVTLMWMPGGRHRAAVSMGGMPLDLDIEVRPEDAPKIQRAFEALCAASPHRPYFDLEHDDKCAAVWPEKFFWSDEPQPGIYATGQLTKAGRDAIEGRTHRGFSAVFYVDNPHGSPSHLAEELSMNAGGFTNNPAFKRSLPLWAKSQAEAAAATITKGPMMTEQETAAAAAKAAQDQAALEAKLKEAERVAQENEQLKQRLRARAEADAKAAVDAAVARGSIPAQDEALRAKWQRWCADSPEMIEALAKLPGRPELASGPIAGKAAVTDDDPKLLAKKLADYSGQQLKAADFRQKIEIAREQGLFYHQAIRKNDRFLDLPLQAVEVSDSLGTLAGYVVSQRTLELMKYVLFPFDSVTTDFSSEPCQYKSSVYTRIVTNLSVATYSPTLGTDGRPGGWTVTAGTTTDVYVAMNNLKGVPVMFDMVSLSGTTRQLFEEFAQSQAYMLSKTISDALLALITTGNFGTRTTLTRPIGDFGRGTFAECKAEFNANGLPIANRFALLNSDYHAALETDSALAYYAAWQKPDIITEGRLPRVSTFQPVEVGNMPTTNNLAAFFCHRSALLLVTRVPLDYTTVLPGASFGNVQIVTNPETGLSAMQIEFVDHVGGYAERNLAVMYGVAVGNASCGQIVKSA